MISAIASLTIEKPVFKHAFTIGSKHKHLKKLCPVHYVQKNVVQKTIWVVVFHYALKKLKKLVYLSIILLKTANAMHPIRIPILFKSVLLKSMHQVNAF